ncbi:MAG: hypothetical protein P1P86_08145 [Bacteroidales bacterium]|nr:hypothetical protein [Bacteroidales bacterium]
MVGASASGKTSLIQSGIIPVLLSDMKEEWVPIYIRPGKRPMESLIRGVQKIFSRKISESDVHSFLNDSQSLGNFLIEKDLGNYHYLLVVDQFEELFTWPSIGKKRRSGKSPDAQQFINHLMRMVDEEEPRIFLMLSIRSEFLDYCSSFRGLTEHLNKSKYLLPRMSRDNLKEAILEPLHVASIEAESGFEDYLLNELEDVEPQLPLLQNALKQTWVQWKKRGKADQPLTLDDYQAGGTIRGGLSRDLENIYHSMEFYQKEICERIFKTIAYKTGRQEVFSRRTSLGSIARIAKCSVDRILEVVDIFEKAGHPFLSNKLSETMSSETRIELPHESLINIWDRLHQWVEEEDESIRMYLYLSQASASYQRDMGALLVADELQKAIDWEREQKPNPAWGIQFDPAYERAMVFLNTSEEEYLWNEKRKIILKRRKHILNRSIIAGSLVLATAIALMVYISQKRPAETDQQVRVVMEQSPSISQGEQGPVMDDIRETGEEGPGPREDQGPDRVNEQDGIRTHSEEPGTEIVIVPAGPREIPGGQAETGETSGETAGENAGVIMEEETEPASAADRMGELIISIAKDAAYQSVSLTRNPDLQGLVAYQAYLLNKRHSGDSFDPDIYKGLYESMKKLISPAYNIYPNLRNSIKAMEWLNRSGSILAASSDGDIKILSGNIANRAAQINLAGTGYNNECLGISPDERIAAVGTNGGGLLFIELDNRGELIHTNIEQGYVVLFIENLGRSGSFLSAGTSNKILKWDYSSFTPSTLVTLSTRPLALVTSGSGSTAAFATATGRLYTMDVRDTTTLEQVNSFGRNQVRALSYSPGERFLAAGMLDGSVKVLSGDGRRNLANLFGPGARISALEFSPDGSLLVAASHDGNVYMWNASDWDVPPVVFTENNGFILSLCFNRNGSYFYSGSVAYPRMVGRPSKPEQMAEGFCSLLGRNLTREEWNRFFGIDMPYEETCPR